ncbi:MAG: SpoIIE family protein phosphatase [Rhodomicrobium sp.]
MAGSKIFRQNFERTFAGAVSAAGWLAEICAREAIADDVAFAMDVCLEELFSNIVRHGGPGASPLSKVGLSIKIEPGRTRMTVTDDGRPFDVSQAPAQKILLPLEQVQPGGLGILLAQKFASRLTYERAGGLNAVTAEFLRNPDDEAALSEIVTPSGGEQMPDFLAASVFHAALEEIAPCRLEPGEVLIRQGEAGETAYFLKSGSVLVYSETSYGPVPLATLHAPRLIGEIAVLAGLPRTASVRTLTPADVFPIPRATLLAIGEKAPNLLVSVIGQLGRQIGGVNKAIGLYTNALAALERREFDEHILADLTNPTPELEAFAAAFRRFADQILHKRRQQDEMASAAIIQQSLLPDPSVLAAFAGRLDLHAEMRAARHVGGDFYDFFMLDDGRLAIAIGDVCGKGIPASLFMAIVVTVLRLAARQERNVQSAVALANSILCSNNASSMFATLIYGVLDLGTGLLEYCNCGHNQPLLLKRHGEPLSLPGGGLPVALFPEVTPQVFRATVEPGDVMVFITDGVTEAMTRSSEEFGEKRLIDMLSGLQEGPASGFVSRIFSAVNAFADGADPSDDITVVALKRLEA